MILNSIAKDDAISDSNRSSDLTQETAKPSDPSPQHPASAIRVTTDLQQEDELYAPNQLPSYQPYDNITRRW